MRGITPSLGALAAFSARPTQIPHIGYHLAQRRTRYRPPLWPRPASRCVHSISPSHILPINYSDDKNPREESGSEEAVESPDEAVPEEADRQQVFSTSSEITHEACPETFDDVLIEGHSERLLRALIGTADGKAFIETASPDRFSAALAAIDPASLIHPFEPVCRLMPSSSARISSLFSRPRLAGQRFAQLSFLIRNIFMSRRNARRRLTPEDYAHLLQLASALRDGRLAKMIWVRVGLHDAFDGKPPLEAYNAYMHGVCWANTHGSEYMSLRATPHQLSLRQERARLPNLVGHGVGSQFGLRRKVLTSFMELVRQGLQGDEDTFTNIMVAMGREADIAGVKSILRSVYNIDVDLLMTVDEEEVETPTFYEQGHPLRPTTRLLYTLAHVFCVNSELPLAVKLVDFVARQYVLPIPHFVWAHLIEWAFVLSTSRPGRLAKERHSVGSIDVDTFESIWTVMTSPPHNIQPDLIMLSLHSRVYSRHWRTWSAITWLDKACQEFEEANPDPIKITQPLLDLSNQILNNSSPTALLPSEWFDLRQTFLLATTQRYRDNRLLQLATHSVLTSRAILRQEQHNSRFHAWAHRTIPDLITRYRPHLRFNYLCYSTPTGTIQLSGLRQYEASDWSPGTGTDHWKLRVLRTLLDKDALLTVADLRTALDKADQAMKIGAPTYSPNRTSARRAEMSREAGGGVDDERRGFGVEDDEDEDLHGQGSDTDGDGRTMWYPNQDYESILTQDMSDDSSPDSRGEGRGGR